MEHLERQMQIMNLGKELVKELDLEDSVDTLARWMAHYLAEKILLAGSDLPSEEKEKVKRDCFETILSLWKHRWLLPAGKRPMEEFEPILQTLERLGADRSDPYFFRVVYRDSMEKGSDPEAEKEVSVGLERALHIDKAARIWIEEVFAEAVRGIDNDRIQTIVKDAVHLPESDDARVIQIFFTESAHDVGDDDFKRRYRKDELKERIKDLENFSLLNERLLASYKAELEQLNGNT